MNTTSNAVEDKRKEMNEITIETNIKIKCYPSDGSLHSQQTASLDNCPKEVSGQSSRGYRGDSYMDSGYFYCYMEINDE